MNTKIEVITRIFEESLEELLRNDASLIEHDVSERAITHKLAEYLQKRLPEYNVDCEYNRNATKGWNEPKQVSVLRNLTQAVYAEGADEAERLAVSAFPDIIVHRRLTNEYNLLIIEVKKKNSSVTPEHDLRKIAAFMENTEINSFGFRIGVFMVIETGISHSKPEVHWFLHSDEVVNHYISSRSRV